MSTINPAVGGPVEGPDSKDPTIDEAPALDQRRLSPERGVLPAGPGKGDSLPAPEGPAQVPPITQDINNPTPVPREPVVFSRAWGGPRPWSAARDLAAAGVVCRKCTHFQVAGESSLAVIKWHEIGLGIP